MMTEATSFMVCTGVQQYLLMAGHLLLLLTAPWTIYVSLDFCAKVFSLKTNYLPLFWGQPKNESIPRKKETSIPPKWYSRRMMRKQHIFLKPLLYSKPRQISFKKFGLVHARWEKTISHEKKGKESSYSRTILWRQKICFSIPKFAIFLEYKNPHTSFFFIIHFMQFYFFP